MRQPPKITLENKSLQLAGDARDTKAVFYQGWMKWLGGLWNPDRGQQRAGPTGYANASLQTVTDARALQVSTVFRCIRIISETVAAIPMYAYRLTPKGKERLEDDHWLPRLLTEPNEVMTGDEWIEAMVSNMCGWGNGYSDIVFSDTDDGRPLALWPLKVDRMDVSRLENRTLRYRYPNAMGSPQDLNAARVLHLRAFSTDGYMGLAPLSLAREALGVAVGAENYAASFYASGGRPSGVMMAEKPLNDKQREQIRKEYGGMADGGTDKRFWLLEGDLKYTAITVNPEDMQMLQTRAFQVADIARFFGVPLFLLMETEKSTTWGSGIEQANLGYLIYTLWPYLSRLRFTMNRRLIPERERRKIAVDHDLSAFLRMDSKTLGEFLRGMVESGLMTRNEARTTYLNLAQKVGADELTAQVNLAPLSMLGKRDLSQEPGDGGTPPSRRDSPLIFGDLFKPITDEIRGLKDAMGTMSGSIGDLQHVTRASVESLRGAKKVTQQFPTRGPDGRILYVETVEETQV